MASPLGYSPTGCSASKTGVLESKDDLKRRIDEAAKYLPLEQLALSPQCAPAIASNQAKALQQRTHRQSLRHHGEPNGCECRDNNFVV